MFPDHQWHGNITSSHNKENIVQRKCMIFSVAVGGCNVLFSSSVWWLANVQYKHLNDYCVVSFATDVWCFCFTSAHPILIFEQVVKCPLWYASLKPSAKNLTILGNTLYVCTCNMSHHVHYEKIPSYGGINLRIFPTLVEFIAKRNPTKIKENLGGPMQKNQTLKSPLIVTNTTIPTYPQYNVSENNATIQMNCR